MVDTGARGSGHLDSGTTTDHVDQWRLPLDRAVRVVGAPGDAIEIALEDLSDTGPAVVRLHLLAASSTRLFVDRVLAALTDIAMELFPAWLPAASSVSGHSSLDFAAVRIHARKLAASSGHYGPFLSDLAEGAVGGSTGRTFSDPERAKGLSAVLGAAWGRDRVALLMSTDELEAHQHRALTSASEWLAARGFGVWLVDTQPPANDRLPSVFVRLPEFLRRVNDDSKPKDRASEIRYWAVSGRPHPQSDVEKLVDRELSRHAWASRRHLNEPFQHSPIAPRYFLDIAWLDDKFVVELDGFEHLSPYRRAKDKERDELLTSLGFGILRIPNERVLADVWQVIGEIESALREHRASDPASTEAAKEGTHP